MGARLEGAPRISRRVFVTGLSAALAAGRLGAQSRRRIHGVWSGGVTASEATVRALTERDVTVTLTLSDGSVDVVRSAAADADGVATFRLAGLRSRTAFRYSVGVPGEDPLSGRFRTWASGPDSFRAVFASCASTGSSSPVFTAMRRQNPDLFIHMGDLHYENIGRNDVSRFRRAYERVLGSPTQAALFRAMPFAYTWDDHDYGPNNSDRTSRSRPAALQAFRRFVPHYPLADAPDAAVYQAFTIGRVRFLMTDVRSARAPKSSPETERTMLGASQLAWFERELETAAATAQLVVWVNTVPWITKAKESTSDGWAQYARERRQIADLIVRLGLTDRLVMLSGDAHMLAMDDGAHSQYSALPDAPARGFVIAHAAPLDRRTTKKGGPYSHAPMTTNGQFGMMDVSDDGRRLSVALQGLQRDGQPAPGMRLEKTIEHGSAVSAV